MRRAGRKLAAALCASLLAACIGPGLEPPLGPSTAQNAAGTGATATGNNDSPRKPDLGVPADNPTTQPPTTAPVMPTMPGGDAESMKPGREVDAGTDDSGVTP